MSQKHSERLAVLLDDLVDFLRGYVVMQAAQADAAILWVGAQSRPRCFRDDAVPGDHEP